ncbi:isochorismatase family protein [Azospirillum brasilense]|uniref:isochorismatase family protein n=1 Tax=Azospirillum brasilense TaxID=192 RepID=UPI000E683CE3|nr:isochorismatase family protein [Azospirillum brasilense]NUB28512.1 isochorismatase family protein [Azospirillum brasilense]NUB35016.1 isochorismatase family protein [Azospirillum brasilense]RIW03442.1 isochorismatase family protein [Azospirillum brasilense]
MTIRSIAPYALPTAADLPQDKVSWSVDPARAVLLIHDMQDYFVGFYGDANPAIVSCIDRIVRLKRHLKALGVPVVYTAQPPVQPDADRGLLNDMWGPGLTAKPDLAGIVAPLAPDADDRVLTKWRYSAFFRAPLTEMMAESGRDQLLICGIYAHIGVMQTALDAFMRGIKPFLIADAIADFSREDHMMALRYVARNAGRTIHSDSLLAAPAAVLSKDGLRRILLASLDEVPGDDDNLMDFGLDSIAVMQVVDRWKAAGVEVGFAELAAQPSINGWWALIEPRLAASGRVAA